MVLRELIRLRTPVCLHTSSRRLHLPTSHCRETGPLTSAGGRLTGVPALAATLPGAAEINLGVQFALKANPLNAVSTLPVLPGDTVDRFQRSGPRHEPGPLRELSNPLFAAIDPETPRGNLMSRSGRDPDGIIAPSGLFASHATPDAREWSIEPHHGIPSSGMPRQPSQAAIPLLLIDAGPELRNGFETGPLVAPSALTEPTAGARDQPWESQPPQGSRAALALTYRGSAALDPKFARISGGPEHSFDSGSLHAPSAMHTPQVGSPQWGWRSRQPRKRGAADAPPNPLVAAFHPAKADIKPGPQFSFDSDSLDAPSALHTPPVGRPEWGWRSPRRDRRGAAYWPPNPIAAKVHPAYVEPVPAPRRIVVAAAPDTPAAAHSRFPAPIGGNPRIDRPVEPGFAVTPLNPSQATFHAQRAEPVAEPRRLVGVAVWNAPTIPRSTLAASTEVTQRIAPPEGPVFVPAPHIPLEAANHPVGTELLSGMRSPSGTDPSDSPVTTRPAIQNTGMQGQQIVRREPLPHVQRTSNPTLAGILPETHATNIDRQLALASGPASAAAPPSVLLSASADRTPGSEASVEPATAETGETPILAAIPPEAAAVSHGREFAHNAGPPLTPPAPRTLLTLQEEPNRQPAAQPMVDAVPGPVAAVQAENRSPGVQTGHTTKVSLASAPAKPLGSTRSPLVDAWDSHPQHAQPAVPESVPGSPTSATSQTSVVMASREPESQGAVSSGPRLTSVPLEYGLANTAADADVGVNTASAEESAALRKPPLVRKTVEVSKGDSLLSLLDMHAVSQSAGLTAITRLRPRLDPKRIRAGDQVSFVLAENDEQVTIEELTVARTGPEGRSPPLGEPDLRTGRRSGCGQHFGGSGRCRK